MHPLCSSSFTVQRSLCIDKVRRENEDVTTAAGELVRFTLSEEVPREPPREGQPVRNIR